MEQETLIPIVAIVMGIGLGFWGVYWDHQRRRLEYDERRLMIEKGMAPPPLLPDRRRRTLGDTLRKGIVMSFLGIALLIGYVIIQGPDIFTPRAGRPQVLAVAAVVLLMLGLGNLVYYRIAKKEAPPNS